jgi:hypothetical protein
MSIGTSTGPLFTIGRPPTAPATTGRATVTIGPAMAATDLATAAATGPVTAAVTAAAGTEVVIVAAAIAPGAAATAAERIRGDSAQRAAFLIVAPPARAL